MISFSTNKADAKTIRAIADRAVRFAMEAEPPIDYELMDAEMDITAVHANDCPLRLKELLVAESFDFAHDVFGIHRHLNRTTGKLENCFSPRFAAR